MSEKTNSGLDNEDNYNSPGSNVEKVQEILQETANAAEEFSKSLSSFAEALTFTAKLNPLTGNTQDYSGTKAIERIREQKEYSKAVLKRQQQGCPDFSRIFSGK